tara:strand:- start:12636 stop:13388 length:753 start_codon:yes stop_codon:yes gene_type:complete
MKIYQKLLTTHNMVLFQGGLGGNFVSYLISIHSLNLPLGNPSVGLAYNEYSMAIACNNADDPYCNSLGSKSYILERHLNLFFQKKHWIETEDGDYKSKYSVSRYHEVLKEYKDTHIIVITIDPTDSDLIVFLSKIMNVKTFYNDEPNGRTSISLKNFNAQQQVFVDSVLHYKWFISRAKKKNINVLEVDYRKLFIERDVTVVSEMLNFIQYGNSNFDLDKVRESIADYHNNNMAVVHEFDKIIDNTNEPI